MSLRTILRFAFFALAGLFGLIALGVVALILFFPKDLAVREATRQIELATHRKLEIAGPVDVSFWPSIGFSAGQVTLSNPEGFEADKPFLSAQRITFAVALIPLLSRHIKVTRLALDGGDINLAAHADGKFNWDFPTESSGSQSGSLDDLQLDDVRLTDTHIAFAGASGEPLEIGDVDAMFRLDSLDKPAKAEGAFNYRGERVQAAFDIGLPRALIEQGATPLIADVKSAPADMRFEGTFNAQNGALDGMVNASGASLRRLSSWMGSPMAEGGGFANYSAAAHMTSAGSEYDFADCVLKLDAIEARGQLKLSFADDGRLKVSGALAAQSLDANVYMPPPAQGEAGMDVDTAWSTAPLDLSGLKALDADLNLTLGTLVFQKMQFSDAALALKVANGALDARLTRISLYGGSGTARLIADARSATPRVAVELSADDVDANALLVNAIGFDNIVGRGRVTASLVGTGASQADIMRTLAGNAGFNLRNGAWKGVNLAQVARSIQALRAGQSPAGTNADTDFAEMSASFSVADGSAATQDLRLLNPFVRIEGQGLVNIGAQSLDMLISPRAVSNAQGQGGAADARGIGIPFRVSGPWAKVNFAPALENAVQNELRNQAQRALSRRGADDPLRQLGDALFGTNASSGSGESTTTSEAPAPSSDTSESTTTTQPAQQEQHEQTPEERARDALGRILGGGGG